MPTKTRKGYLDGPTGQIHYQEAGEGLPLVLLHQSPSSSEMFKAVYSELANRGIRAIGIDTPGFGMSDVPAEPPSISDYANAISQAMDELRLKSPAVLGHHTGASIAAEIAVTRPELVGCLILNGPAQLTEQERDDFRKALRDAPKFEPVSDGSHLTALWKRREQFTPGWTSMDAMHWGVVQMLVAGDTEWYGHAAAFDHDIAEPLSRVQQPTMILTNTGDDIYYAAQRVRELRPDFTYRELEGGTHDIVDEQPQGWSDLVAEFVKANRV